VIQVKKLLITIVIVAVIGYFGYKQVNNYMANQVIKQVAKTLTPNEVAKLTNDPVLAKQAKHLKIDTNKLTPQDKKEVMTIVTKDFSPAEIKDIATKIGSGNLTSEDKQQLISEYKSRLSPEDLAKIKQIAAQQVK
jgi:uncharacterized membrane protein YebE (DUF533 family)